MTVHALIPAAGRGERLRAPASAPSGSQLAALPKQFLPVAGRPLLVWAVERLHRAGVDAIVVAAPAEMLDETRELLRGVQRARVVTGGATRQDSVARALHGSQATNGDLVLVHDAARAAVHPDDVRATIAAAAASDADGAVLGRPMTDTVKRLLAGRIEETIERSALFRAETPQVFRREVLARAIERAVADGFVGTDESSLVERLPGARIVAVVAQWPNPKVTFASDLERLERMLPERGARGTESGGPAAASPAR